MSKKFDVVIGNPPYQEEAVGGTTRTAPIYHHFMDAAHQVGDRAILITPARFLFDAGRTPKAWNQQMLADKHLSAPVYVANSNDLFPGTDIKGGVAVTYRNALQAGDPIGVFVKHATLKNILDKVQGADPEIITDQMTSLSSHSYSKRLFDEHPDAALSIGHNNLTQIMSNAFDVLPKYFFQTAPDDGNDYVAVLGISGRDRVRRWIRRDYLSLHDSEAKYSIALPKANGSGEFGEKLTKPEILEPGTAVTVSFVTIGAFDSREEAELLLKYLKSKFARAMLGISKVTQDSTRPAWKHVPLQDFTKNSDIDWSKSIPEIDAQLYEKYGLNNEEIDFIESRVKPME